jgi:hypothetical protein
MFDHEAIRVSESQRGNREEVKCDVGLGMVVQEGEPLFCFGLARSALQAVGANGRAERKEDRRRRSKVNQTAICSPSDSQRNLLIFHEVRFDDLQH